MADELEWETQTVETAYSCPGFDIVHEDVTLPDGTETDFDFLREGDSVVVLPLTGDGEVVVIEEWRQAVKRVNRGLPAGSVEATDDEPRAAVARELREETAFAISTPQNPQTVTPTPSFTTSSRRGVRPRPGRTSISTSPSASERRASRSCSRPSGRVISGTGGPRWESCTTRCSSGRTQPLGPGPAHTGQ